VESGSGSRQIPVEELFQKPTESSKKLSTVNSHELITGIEVPKPQISEVGTYVKKMSRNVWTFATASVAARLRIEDNLVTDAHLVLGGVSQTPWRINNVETILKGKTLDDGTIEEASQASTAGARPLKYNSYKVTLTKGIVIEALTKLR
jgi:xanthine dehydrogenase YagS FAD-binding subunit